MKICVLNYELAREFEPTEPTLAIRIFDPDCDRVDGNNSRQILKTSDLWVGQLCYTFDDIDLCVYELEQPETFLRLQKEYKCFDTHIAKKIVADFDKYRQSVSAIMLHCNAGISRSVAVAAALIKRFKIQPEYVGKRTKGLMESGDYIGNEWIYNGILDV